jgi:hypothetical protein
MYEHYMCKTLHNIATEHFTVIVLVMLQDGLDVI